jgi:hypothetical protein
VAISAIQSGAGPLIPTALIAATTTPANTASLDTTFAPWIIRKICGREPVAGRFTAQGWRTEFGANHAGEDNDGIVGLSSQLNGFPATPAGNPVAGLIHSAGLHKLGFSGPTELDSATAIQTLIVTLLNEPVTGPDFHPLP